MSIHWNEKANCYDWSFKRTVDGQRHRFTKRLPSGWTETQAKRYDEQETARTYARLATGRRVPAIAIVVDLYLRERVPQLKDGINSARNLAHLLPYIEGKGLDQLGVVCRSYRPKLKPATIRQRLATLRAAAFYALKHHQIGKREWLDAIAMPSVDNARNIFLSRREVLTLARACKHPPTRALVLMTFATGSRPGELHAMTPGDGYFEKVLKNGDRQRLPVPLRFRYLMRWWPMQWSYTAVSKQFRAARNSVGMDHVNLHDLRHSTASALIEAGSTLAEVGLVLNHKSPQATKRYTHLSTDAKQRVLERLWQKRADRR